MLPYINTPFDYVGGQLGASTDECKLSRTRSDWGKIPNPSIVKFLFLLLISYPLAGLLKRIPDARPSSKNAFIIGITTFYLVGLFDLWSGVGVLVLDAVVTYLIAAYIQGPYMPWVGFVFLMGHMSVSHIYRKIAASPSSIDITGAQMVTVMKLSSFCWHIWDGRRPSSELNEEQKDRALQTLPSPLDYAGYVAFFPSIMAGPAFDFVDYQRWLNTSMFDLPPGTDPAKAPLTRKKRRIPRSGTPAMRKMAVGLGWTFAFLQCSRRFNNEMMLGKTFADMSFPIKLITLYMFNFVTRMKYYGVWTLTEGACILAGIGYKGVDPITGKPNWDRLTNIKPLGVEFAQNSHAYLGNWNINTNNWLRHSIYLRVTPKGKKPGFRASMATFVTSAFWHGFESGYYLTFVLGSFVQNIAKNSRRLLRPFFMSKDGSKPLPRKRYYDIATWLLTQITFSFVTTPFILLDLRDSLLVWSRVYYYAIVGVALCSVFLASPGKVILLKKVKAYTTRPSVSRNESQENLQGATLGIPVAPGKEWDEMVEEITQEVKRRRGSAMGPDGAELRVHVEDALKKTANGLGIGEERKGQ